MLAVSAAAFGWVPAVAGARGDAVTSPHDRDDEDDAKVELARYDLLAAVSPPWEEQLLIRNAWNVVFGGCMRAAGFSMPEPVVIEPEPAWLQLARLRFDDVDLIGRYGYDWILSLRWPLDTADDAQRSDLPEPMLIDIPIGVEDGCRQRANYQVYADASPQESINLVLYAQRSIIIEVSSRPEIEAAEDAWNVCMEREGYPDEDFTDRGRIIQYIDQPVTEAQISYALADSRCRGESGYRDTFFGLLADGIRQWLADNADIVAEMRQDHDAQLERASVILGS